MARVTRQSARNSAALSSQTTPLSNVSPVVSSRPESVVEEPETPATSEAEDVPLAKARSASARGRLNTGRKRPAAESDNDMEDVKESISRAPAAKRRAVSSQVYVSIPVPTSSTRKAKVKPSREVSWALVPQEICI